MSLAELQDVEPERRAAVALDSVRRDVRQWHFTNRRPRALSAREALEALHFESLVLWTAWSNARAGVELTAEDHERIDVAMSRILAIYEEAAQ